MPFNFLRQKSFFSMIKIRDSALLCRKKFGMENDAENFSHKVSAGQNLWKIDAVTDWPDKKYKQNTGTLSR
jgi:hypothetical protein